MSGETKKTEFIGASGETLAAALEMPLGKPRGFVLFAHCFTCTKDLKSARLISKAMRDNGFAVLRFDFTGLGGSEGDFENTNFSSNVADLVKAADFLREEHEAPSIIVGHSLGGSAALIAASEIPEVKAVASIGAPADASHVAHQFGSALDAIRRSGNATVTLAGRPFTITRQFIDDLSGQNVIDKVRDLGKPLLVMHAPLDDVVGIENATEIFVAAKHPKSFVSLDTADHLLHKTEDARYAADVLAAWAARFVGKSPTPQPNTPSVEVASGDVVARAIPGSRYGVSVDAGGHDVVIDVASAIGGDDLGPNPTLVLEAALAACSVITMEMYAERKGWSVDDLAVSVRRAAGEDPHAAKVLEKAIGVAGGLSDEQKQRLREIAGRCPVHKMLSDGVSIHDRTS